MAITYPVRPYAVTRAEYTSSVRSILESLIYSNILLQKKGKKNCFTSQWNITVNYIFKDSHNHHSFYVGVYGSLSKKSKALSNEWTNKMSPIALVLSSSIFLTEQCTHKVPSTSPFSANPCISNSRVAWKKKKPYPKLSYPFRIWYSSIT